MVASLQRAIVPTAFAELLGEAQCQPELNQSVYRVFVSNRRVRM